MSENDLHTILLEAFAAESDELLTRIAAQLAQLDQGTVHPNEVLRQINRDLHTLKGASTTIEQESVVIVCQALEDFTDDLVNGGRALDRGAIECLRRAVKLVADVCRGGPEIELGPILNSLHVNSGWRALGISAYEPEIHDLHQGVQETPSSVSVGLEPVAVNARIRALQLTLSALQSRWNRLHTQLESQASVYGRNRVNGEEWALLDQLSEFSIQLQDAIRELDDLAQQSSRDLAQMT